MSNDDMSEPRRSMYDRRSSLISVSSRL